MRVVSYYDNARCEFVVMAGELMLDGVEHVVADRVSDEDARRWRVGSRQLFALDGLEQQLAAVRNEIARDLAVL